jgi:glutaredoxin-like YruB-family protein
MSRPVFSLARAALLALSLTLCLGALPALAGPPSVELYVTSWCPYCKKAASYFKSKGIPFKEMDVEKDAAAATRFQKYGARGVPLVVIDGKPIAGYSIEEYERALSGK